MDDEDLLGLGNNVTSIGSMPLGGLISGGLGSQGSGFGSGAGQKGLGVGSGAGFNGSGVWGGCVPEALVGVPVAANRGASGIDGVLSTAAGFAAGLHRPVTLVVGDLSFLHDVNGLYRFAAGLHRPVTLVVGDLSFLHDVNGLSLLRGGEMAPPLTVVLINNRGGAIFSFLPVAGAVGQEAFERLWGTPQNVDLEGICRAHGIPHQRVTSPNDLAPALATAWGINRHSIVEGYKAIKAKVGRREDPAEDAAAYQWQLMKV
ncbi:hypothetical protein OEZ86_013366 [Tetradesmus obliquus]|nr:hypothetical protein OEZ86_013366 [Tetradesmus obliquus]